MRDLLRGKIDLFSADALVSMLGHAGARVDIFVDPGKRKA
jgi:predicted XRE-type DNA-binding protein